LEWIYAELKDVCSMDVILKALDSIMGKDSNIVVSLCEDDQEDFFSNPASADGNRALQPSSCFLSTEPGSFSSSSSSSSSSLAAAAAAAEAADAAAEAAYEELNSPVEASCSSSSAATKFYEVESITILKALSSSSSSLSSAAAAATEVYEVESRTTVKASSPFQLELSQLLLLKMKRRLRLSQLSAEIKKSLGVVHFYKTIIVVIVHAVNNEAKSKNIQRYGRRRPNS
jgi:hypothetical protein